MFDIGRICVKIAGRDAGKRCVIVEKHDNGLVLIDGQVRRRKSNVKHLEPLDLTVSLSAGASHEQVKKALATINIEVRDTKPKNAAPRPRKQKAQRPAPEPAKTKKAAPKKQEATPAPQEQPAEPAIAQEPKTEQ